MGLDYFTRQESAAITRQRKLRQRAIVGALLAFVVLVYAITIVKLGRF
jgi:hypothetical protein